MYNNNYTQQQPVMQPGYPVQTQYPGQQPVYQQPVQQPVQTQYQQQPIYQQSLTVPIQPQQTPVRPSLKITAGEEARKTHILPSGCYQYTISEMRPEEVLTGDKQGLTKINVIFSLERKPEGEPSVSGITKQVIYIDTDNKHNLRWQPTRLYEQVTGTEINPGETYDIYDILGMTGYLMLDTVTQDIPVRDAAGKPVYRTAADGVGKEAVLETRTYNRIRKIYDEYAGRDIYVESCKPDMTPREPSIHDNYRPERDDKPLQMPTEDGENDENLPFD